MTSPVFRLSWRCCAAIACLSLVFAGCRKKTPVASVPPAPTPVASPAPEPPRGEPAAPAPTRTAEPAPAVAPAPPAHEPAPAFASRVASELREIYFDYDQSQLRADARDILDANARALQSILAAFPGETVVIEGHCDERGSAEYNLGLGDRRARAALDYLVQHGVPQDRLRIVSYGRERPQCAADTEPCHQRNRRAAFAPSR